MIATLEDGTKREIRPGSSTMGLRIKSVELTLKDTLNMHGANESRFLDWFGNSVITRLTPQAE